MANTLYIVEDAVFTGLPSAVQTTLIATATTLWNFVPLKIKTQQPSNFPAQIDFTDSIVKLCETENEVSAIHNQANRAQMANLQYSANEKNVPLNFDTGQRAAAVPERGGVGWQWKIIQQVNNDRVGICATGGVGAIETAKYDVLTGFAGGKDKDEIEAERKRIIDQRANRLVRNKGATRDDAELGARLSSFGRHDSLVYIQRMSVWDWQAKPLSTWPKDYQDATGVALARLIAHEARHQYVLAHSGAGLGSDGAILWAQAGFAQFDQNDQTQIAAAITKLKAEQKRARSYLETFPAGQTFPFA